MARIRGLEEMVKEHDETISELRKRCHITEKANLTLRREMKRLRGESCDDGLTQKRTPMARRLEKSQARKVRIDRNTTQGAMDEDRPVANTLGKATAVSLYVYAVL